MNGIEPVERGAFYLCGLGEDIIFVTEGGCSSFECDIRRLGLEGSGNERIIVPVDKLVLGVTERPHGGVIRVLIWCITWYKLPVQWRDSRRRPYISVHLQCQGYSMVN